MLAHDKTSLTRKNKIDLSKSSICGDFKALTWFRQSLLYPPHSRRQKKALSAGWVLTACLNVNWDLRYPVKWIQDHVDQSSKFTAVVLVLNKVEKVVHTVSTFRERKKCREDIDTKVPHNAMLRGVIKPSPLNVVIRRSDKERVF